MLDVSPSLSPARFERMLERRGVTLDADELARVFSGRVDSLLTVGNPKIVKGTKKGWHTAILHLAPADASGFEVCPRRTAGCTAACLNTAGRGGLGLDAVDLNTIQRARRRKSHWFFARRTDLLARLVREVELHERKARKLGYRPAIRLNGTSDLKWEMIPVVRNGRRYPNIMRAFRYVRFYDYTKRTDRTDLPRNYSLTFSLADGNESDAEIAFAAGMNVAAVVRTPEIARRAGTRYATKAPLPTEYKGRPMIDGDETDLRFLDPTGVWVGLRAKGRAVKDTSGFVLDLAA